MALIVLILASLLQETSRLLWREGIRCVYSGDQALELSRIILAFQYCLLTALFHTL
jgi:hypothetical protein